MFPHKKFAFFDCFVENFVLFMACCSVGFEGRGQTVLEQPSMGVLRFVGDTNAKTQLCRIGCKGMGRKRGIGTVW